jgi:hypothetical protein
MVWDFLGFKLVIPLISTIKEERKNLLICLSTLKIGVMIFILLQQQQNELLKDSGREPSL